MTIRSHLDDATVSADASRASDRSIKSIALVYFNAGGGHRASATALEAVIRQQGRPWRVHLVNLLEVLDPQDSFRKLMGFAPEDIYNKRLARGWTIGLAQELKLLQGMIRMGHPTLVRTLQQHWLKTEPDLVVSLIPNFNRALHEGLATSLPGVPYVTVLTDLADHPPNFWIEAERPQHFICGTAKAVAQARATAHPASTVHASSGMILRPDFYRPPTGNRAEAQRRVGLDPGRPTGLVMFGGQGSKAMLSIAKQLTDTQLVLVCGHNTALADKLRALPAQAPRHVIGFTADIPAVMRLADFFIGKPGPGSLSEAVQQHLPVIVVRNAWTMPQERYNTHWVRDHGLGLVLKSFSGIDLAVQEMTRRLDEFKANTRGIDNRAVFEIPEMLASILARSECASTRGLHAALRL